MVPHPVPTVTLRPADSFHNCPLLIQMHSVRSGMSDAGCHFLIDRFSDLCYGNYLVTFNVLHKRTAVTHVSDTVMSAGLSFNTEACWFRKPNIFIHGKLTSSISLK